MTETHPLAQSIASAPGDLPMPDIEARSLARRRQFRHDTTISPLAPAPDTPVEIVATSGQDVRLLQAAVFYTVDGSVPDAESPTVPMTREMEWEPQIGFLSRWRGVIPAAPNNTVVRYRIGGWTRQGEAPDCWAFDGQGFWFRFPGELNLFAYRVQEPRPPLPAWAHDAVIYHIFLDRFHPGTPDGRFPGPQGARDRHGGNLAGVRQSLPYLAELGVTCLWLSPLHPADTYHRYDGKDFRAVDPELGTLDELRALTAEAHRLGMRVLLDYVPSHCSWRHPAFEAARADRSAPTASWFTFDSWPDRYRCFLQVAKNLPSFNLLDPGAREYLIESARFWLQEVGVDGFRLDHTIAGGSDFWTAFQTAMVEAQPEVVTIAEATDTPEALRRYRTTLNAVLDFPLARALRLTFAVRAWNVAGFDAFLSDYERFMQNGPGRVSFLDNHDMERFLFLAGGDTARLKLGALCQFTLDAVPTIYYGTEIGLSHRHGFAASGGFGGDAEARRDMPWDPAHWDLDLLAFYRDLIRLRGRYPVLRHGTRRTLHVDPSGAYAYLRSSEEGEVLVAMNLGESEVAIALPEGVWEPQLMVGAVRLEGNAVRLGANSGVALA